jgi:hypothetical protein
MKFNLSSLIIIVIIILSLTAVSCFYFFQLGERIGIDKGLLKGEENGYVKGANVFFPYEYDRIMWAEYNGRYSTNNVTRAQHHVPFTILLPTYIPQIGETAPIPIIDGPLDYLNTTEKEINIKYVVSLTSYIVINESNYYQYGFGDNKDNEMMEINGKQVIKSKENSSQIRDHYFSYNSLSTHLKIYFHDIPAEEAMLVIESLIKQVD